MSCPQEYCTSNGFQERARDFFENFLGMPVTSETARLIGIPGFLRGAEAMDSVKNFVDSAQADEGDYVIGFLFCGIVEVCLLAPSKPYSSQPHTYTGCV